MGTRCAMILRSREVYYNGETRREVMRAYRHFDGYPEGMGKDIALACKHADERNEREPEYRQNNRNWGQSFLAALMSSDADIEIEPMDYEHSDIEFLYVVEGTRDLCGGKVPVSGYGIKVFVYHSDSWDDDYETIMGNTPIFCGGWDEMLKWIDEG